MQPDLIYDVGMNNGDDTAYYLFKGYRVVAVDADPTLIDAARSRFAAEIAAGRLTLLNVGIGPDEGIAKFYICEGKSEWNSFDVAIASRLGPNYHAIDVPCRRFRNILGQHGVPLYLKIDIEGHDHYCLADLDPAELPKYASVEMTRLEDLIALRDLGYNAFKIVTQTDFSQLRPEPSLAESAGQRRVSNPGFHSCLTRAAVSPAWLGQLLESLRPAQIGQWLRRRLAPYPRVYDVARNFAALKRRLGDPLQRRPAAGDAPVGNVAPAWAFPSGSSGPFGEETDGTWQTFEEAAYAWLHYRLGYSKYGRRSLNFWHDVHATKV